jgi:hypothetical protein
MSFFRRLRAWFGPRSGIPGDDWVEPWNAITSRALAGPIELPTYAAPLATAQPAPPPLAATVPPEADAPDVTPERVIPFPGRAA